MREWINDLLKQYSSREISESNNYIAPNEITQWKNHQLNMQKLIDRKIYGQSPYTTDHHKFNNFSKSLIECASLRNQSITINLSSSSLHEHKKTRTYFDHARTSNSPIFTVINVWDAKRNNNANTIQYDRQSVVNCNFFVIELVSFFVHVVWFQYFYWKVRNSIVSLNGCSLFKIAMSLSVMSSTTLVACI